MDVDSGEGGAARWCAPCDCGPVAALLKLLQACNLEKGAEADTGWIPAGRVLHAAFLGECC